MEKQIKSVQAKSKFNNGDVVQYRNGMDFKDFNGKVEESINYKGLWLYSVKDFRSNSVKKVAEKYLDYLMQPVK